MPQPRDHFRYELYDGRNLVYVGITNDLERRFEEHRDDGKRFTRMEKVGPAVTQETAEDWEEDRLGAYQRSHRGRTPRYNKTER